jgi:hypothetical protein
MPEQQRGRLWPGERTPALAGSVVLVDVPQVVDVGRVAVRFIGGGVRVAQVSQRGVGTFGECLRAELDFRQADQADIVARQRRESQEARQHARETESANRRRQRARLSRRRHHVG